MVLETVDRYGVRIATMHSSFTCICIPLILITLVYTDNLYNIGKYKSFSVLAALVFSECVKLAWCYTIKDETTLHKDVKRSKKYGSKIKLKEIFKFISVIIGMTGVYFVFAIFFGASIFSHHEETLMLSALITILTVFPGCIHCGVDVTISLLAGMKPLPGDLLAEIIQRNIQCTIFGAWFGAVVIPLDWNRPWQQWPIPCVLGAIIGYTVAHIFTLLRLVPTIARFFTKKKYVV